FDSFFSTPVRIAVMPATFSKSASKPFSLRLLTRLSIALLTAVMPTAIAVGVTAQESLPLVEFSDTQGHWAAACIERMGSGDYMKGDANRRFLPNNTMTRAEFAAVMVKIYLNAPKIRNAPRFSDVPANFWANDAITQAYERGLLSGYSNSQFRPFELISRAQAMTVFAKAEKLPSVVGEEAVLNRFYVDQAQIPSYARGAIAAATTTDKRLVVNYPNVEQFRPNDSILRGEVAAVICQATRDGSDYRANVPEQYIVTLVNRWRDRLAANPNRTPDGTTVFFNKDGFGLKMGDPDGGGHPQWGIIDRSGRWVVEPRFVSLDNFSDGLAIGQVEQNSQNYEVLDQQGRTVFSTNYPIRYFSEGLAAFIDEQGLWGFVDKTGQVAISPQFFEVAPFSDGLARVSKINAEVFGADEYGFINKSGEVVIPLQYKSIQETFEEGLVGALDDDSGQWGYLNKVGEWAITPQFTAVQSFSEGLAGATKSPKTNEQWGFIDRAGVFAIAPQYFASGPVYSEVVGAFVGPNAVTWFNEGFATVRLGAAVGLIDRTGRWRLKPTDFDGLITDIGPVRDGIVGVALDRDEAYVQIAQPE
ncbi:MAG: WG repeat-containing protein, partial [Phormidesmis sp.]